MFRKSLSTVSSRAGALQQGFKELCTFGTSAAAAAAPSGLSAAPVLSRAPWQPLFNAASYASPAGLKNPWQSMTARGYAQLGTKMPRSGYTAPVEMQRQMQMRLSMVSANLLAEPYRGIPPRLPIKAYFTLSGWKEVWRRFLGQFKSLYTLAKCKKRIPGFNRRGFKEESLVLYKDICRFLAEGEKGSLRQLVTPAVFSDMKRQLKQREDGGWTRVQWDILKEPTVEELTTVHGRLIMTDPKDDTNGFAQLTVRIPSKQRFAAYDRTGRLVAGNPEQVIDVEDYWVFEHGLKQSPANRWRLAGRLSILPDTAGQAQQAGAATVAVEQQQPEQQHQQLQPAVDSQQPSTTAAASAASQPKVPHVQKAVEQQRPQRQQQWGDKPKSRKAAVTRGRR